MGSHTAAEGRHQKTVEFTIEMRPDVALGIANALLTSLGNLPDSRKTLYGIPRILTPIDFIAPGFPL
jgi:hypothetical protein